MELIDIVGYIASGLVLASFLMRKMTYLRIVNTIGCGFFIGYGIVLGQAPIVITNAAIVLINIFYLTKSNKSY